MDKIVVGLDIGTTKICALVGRKDDFGKIEILGMGKAKSEGVIRGVVSNISQTVHAINEAIAEAEKQSNTNIRAVNVGIAGQHIESLTQHGSIIRKSSDDEITMDDLNRLNNDMYATIVPPGTEILHVMPQDYILDGEPNIKEPVGMSGSRLEADFNIITAQASAIRNIKRCVMDHCQIEIDNLILEPIASSMAVLTEEEREAGVVLVDIGGGTTDVAVFYENIIRHTAVIPFAGNSITSDIKEGCKIMDSSAEKLKTTFGCAIAHIIETNEFVQVPVLKGREPKLVGIKDVAMIIEARMQEIIELVHNEIIKSGYVNKLVGGIVVTGGGSQLRGADTLFQAMTGMETRIGHPNEYLGRSKIQNDVAQNPMYATTVGLVLAGFRAIDERQNKIMKFAKKNSEVTENKDDNTKKTTSTKGGGFFSNIGDRLKKFLLDDDANNTQY
jgi:cell division protein FtsA